MLTLDKLLIEQGDFRLEADLTISAPTALLGPSGAGKSTLLSAIAGFIPPASGRILWQGADLAGLAAGLRPMSILFQEQNLFPHLSVAQNIGLGLRVDLRLSADQRAQVARAMEETGLSDLGDRRPAQLSGGQQSRVALARALLRARPILLLDEPFAALGPALKQEMLALVKAQTEARGILPVLVTHAPEDARALCPQTIIVAEGCASPPAQTKALLANPPAALKAYLHR